MHAGIRVGLISNIWRPYFQSAQDCYGDLFAQLTAPVLLSCEEGIAKPCARFFKRAAERAGVTPSECVMAGDTYETDVSGAAAAGMMTIWVLHRPDVEAPALVRLLNGEAPKPNATIAHIGDLSAALIHSVVQHSQFR
jgi:FMN phosphatase YigB (HAD superfamily)